MKVTPLMMGAGAAVVVVVGLMVAASQKGAAGVGQAAGVAAGSAIAGAAGGVILGVGDGIGLPRPSMTECERAKYEGRTWDASFACGAGDFLGYWWNK